MALLRLKDLHQFWPVAAKVFIDPVATFAEGHLIFRATRLKLGQGKAVTVQPLLARALADHGEKERAIGILEAYLKDHRGDVAANILLESLKNFCFDG